MMKASRPSSLCCRAARRLTARLHWPVIQFVLHQHRASALPATVARHYVGEPFRALDWQLQGMTFDRGTTYGIERNGPSSAGSCRTALFELARQQLGIGVPRGTPRSRMLRRDGIAAAGPRPFYSARPAAPRLDASAATAARSWPTSTRLRPGSNAYMAFRDFVAATYLMTAWRSASKHSLRATASRWERPVIDWALGNNLPGYRSGADLCGAWPIVRYANNMIDLAHIGLRHRTLPADGPSRSSGPQRLAKDSPRSDTEMIVYATPRSLVDYGAGGPVRYSGRLPARCR